MAHLCAITPVAQMVGSNRIVPAQKIVNPVGNENLTAEEERKLRRFLMEKALKALETQIQEQKVMA